jgi:hypothetical protein
VVVAIDAYVVIFYLMDIILAPYLYSPPFLLSQNTVYILLYYIVSYQLNCNEKHCSKLNRLKHALQVTGMLLRPRVYSAGWRVFDLSIQFMGFLTRPGLHLSSVSNSPRVGAQILSRK